MKLLSSYVCLNKLRFHARHGVLPQERATGGEFVVSIRAKYLFDKAIVRMEIYTDSNGRTSRVTEVYFLGILLFRKKSYFSGRSLLPENKD